MIRPATAHDVDAITGIYNHYVQNTIITFEEVPVLANEMSSRLHDVEVSLLPWIVLEKDSKLIGYAYATKWKARAAYRYSVESTVYLDPAFVGHGYGTKLYEELFARLRQNRVRAVMGGIALPNPASIALHEKLGMTQVAHFKQVGFKFDRWIDVGYWQRLLL